MYEHNSGMHLRIARNIEVAITKSILPDGRIDLEDTFAIARLGEDLVRRAQRAAGSFDFQRYIVAKDVAGEYIIPKEEQKFLKTWLEYSVKTK